MQITRRTLLERSGQVVALGALTPLLSARAAQAQTLPTAVQASKIDAVAQQFMQQFSVPGMSVAIARHGRMVFQSGYGLANKETGDHVTTESRFRIASVSKPFTSTTIFTLIEQGKLKLDDFVFGSQGVLKNDFGTGYLENINRIMIHHLLTHTGGGWQNDGDDPMFRNTNMNHHDLIAWTLHNQPLKNPPGMHFAYSNFGYCVLGRVIEKLTGKPYEEYVKSEILSKCGIADMQIGTNTPAKNEVHYYPLEDSTYTMNVTRMDSHGGWIASPTDLVRFSMHVDGFSSTPNILTDNSIAQMTTATVANKGYACGWAVNQVPNWWHNGSLPGTSSIMVRTASGLCWAAITNIRAEGIDLALDEMMWNMAKAVPGWRA